jgi:multiple sugar transport system substrate-binding protein
MAGRIHLRGTCWDHPRGRDPLVGTVDAYRALAPDVSVEWTARSLQAFADESVVDLATRYDLLVIDHPFVGEVSATGALLPLDTLLPADVLEDQARNSVGPSHRSYTWAGHQWALAVDAAAQVSAHRPDLVAALGMEPPGTWDEMLELADRARADGRWIAWPFIPIDAVMSFLSLLANAGSPMADDGRPPDREAAAAALDLLARLLGRAHPKSADWNPPKTLDAMSSGDDIVASPMLFGYSNYARPGFRPYRIRFAGIPSAGHGRVGGILGGAGIAISAACAEPEAAAAYVAWLTSGPVQAGEYVRAGGQPGHRAAWLDPSANEVAGGFFGDTLVAMDAAYLRPRTPGMMAFQDEAGRLIRRTITEGAPHDACLDTLERLAATTLGSGGAGHG